MTLGTCAQNLVLNGSFESNGGSFANWNVANNSGFLAIDSGTILSAPAQNGSYAALFGGSVPDTISQSVPTTSGLTYDVSFWVNDRFGSSALSVSWGSSQLLNLANSYTSETSGQFDNGWVDFNFLVPASSSSENLKFAGSSGTALGVDNVSVTVPEPGLFSLIGGFLAVGGLWRRSRRAGDA